MVAKGLRVLISLAGSDLDWNSLMKCVDSVSLCQWWCSEVNGVGRVSLGHDLLDENADFERALVSRILVLGNHM